MDEMHKRPNNLGYHKPSVLTVGHDPIKLFRGPAHEALLGIWSSPWGQWSEVSKHLRSQMGIEGHSRTFLKSFSWQFWNLQRLGIQLSPKNTISVVFGRPVQQSSNRRYSLGHFLYRICFHLLHDPPPVPIFGIDGVSYHPLVIRTHGFD